MAPLHSHSKILFIPNQVQNGGELDDAKPILLDAEGATQNNSLRPRKEAQPFSKIHSPVIRMYSIIKHCTHEFVQVDEHWKICKKCPLIVEVS